MRLRGRSVRPWCRSQRASALPLTGLRGFNEAIITQGGVAVKEIDPGTMESKKAPGAVLCRGGSGFGCGYRGV